MPTAVQSEPFVQKSPRSALRHRPIQSETSEPEVVIRTPRASRIKTSWVSDTLTTAVPVATTLSRKRTSRRGSAMRGSWLVYLVLGMLVTMLLLWVGQIVWSWGDTTMDDLHYGRPRTFQMDAFVGHETGTVPSHFIALNLHGHIEIIELPGGDATHAKIYIGPQIYGPGADLVPVTLRFVDPSQSHHPDMLVLFQGDQIVFHNVQGGFQQFQS